MFAERSLTLLDLLHLVVVARVGAGLPGLALGVELH